MLRLVVSFSVALSLLLASPVSAAEVTVLELVADGSRYSDVEVTVTGELIGDYGNRRDGFTWTQLNGDSYTRAPVADGGELVGANVGIGIRVDTELAEGLDPPGRYRTVGPIVVVTGIWKYHDPARQGETYLDVTAIETVVSGRVLHEPPLWWAFAVGLALMAVSGGLWLRYTRRRDAVG
ncbi:MAG: hypothetical protein M3112_02230 [Actinomycetia bacterium]|nr:hypothetical protein [Actinomycetes bacterium]